VRSARFRTACRAFSVLLLVWTAADLCGHGLCVHDREPVVPTALAPAGRTVAITAPAGGPADTDADNGPDDCFCCCHCVDVQVRFQIPVVYTFVSAVFFEHRSFEPLAPSPLYHPPLV
jgi:hypothetical protein